MTKTIFESKTFYLNLLVILSTTVVELADVAPVMGVDPKHILITVAIANIVLRRLTSEPVTVRPRDPNAERP